jgi:hypothetical protein
MTLKLFSGDDLTRATDEKRQDLTCLRSYLDAKAETTQFARCGIQLERSEPNHLSVFLHG